MIIVDEQDNEIGIKSVAGHDDIYRVSALWLTNKSGEILLARRAYTKKHHPGKWGPAVAGTVEEGETYLSNIVKETEEELGLKFGEQDFILGPKYLSRETWTHWGQWFLVKKDIPLGEMSPEEDEVAEIRWFKPEDLEKELKSNPEEFLSGFTKNNWLELFKNEE